MAYPFKRRKTSVPDEILEYFGSSKPVKTFTQERIRISVFRYKVSGDYALCFEFQEPDHWKFLMMVHQNHVWKVMDAMLQAVNYIER